MNIRTVHRRLALIFSPFLLLTSVTGILLLFRKDDLYSREVKSLLIGLHNWEIGMKYIGSFLGIGLIIICITGIMLFMKTKKF